MEKKRYIFKIGVLAIAMGILFLILCFMWLEKDRQFLVLQDLAKQNIDTNQLSIKFEKQIEILRIGVSIHLKVGLILLLILINDFRDKKITVLGLYIALVMIYGFSFIVISPFIFKSYNASTFFFPVNINVINIFFYATQYFIVFYLFQAFKHWKFNNNKLSEGNE